MEYRLPGADTADRKEAQWDSLRNRNALHHDWSMVYVGYAFVEHYKTVHLSSYASFTSILKLNN